MNNLKARYLFCAFFSFCMLASGNATTTQASQASLNLKEVRLKQQTLVIEKVGNPADLLPRSPSYYGRISFNTDSGYELLRNAEILKTSLGEEIKSNKKNLNAELCKKETQNIAAHELKSGLLIDNVNVLSTRKGKICIVTLLNTAKEALIHEKTLVFIRSEGHVIAFNFKFVEFSTDQQKDLLTKFADEAQIIHH